MGWAELRKAIANDKSNTANWSDDSSSVEVTQRKGFMCNVKARGKLQMEPGKVFDILVAPDNYRYFSGIKVRAFLVRVITHCGSVATLLCCLAAHRLPQGA